MTPLFESCTQAEQSACSPEQTKMALTGLIFVIAPAAGFEPATNALHVIQYFRKGVDYIFAVSARSGFRHFGI
ncbi:MAG: hypothetical protein A3H76_05245 [Candidatus Lloydbacteria bacterium RIFCSPLOWO2_02_FULL_54_12]|nr:MAG: hypothetical protein A3H76_05245 [Candidatus Lloydbacteria bacterium RIFCSPLOWO2_02_FULL_54_12]